MFACCIPNNVTFKDSLIQNEEMIEEESEHNSEEENQDDSLLLNKSLITQRSRRSGVSAEAVTAERMAQWKKPYYPKTKEEKFKIKEVIDEKIDVLFGHLDEDAKTAVVDAMFLKPIKKNEILIKQGEEGDYFYIVEKGSFDIFVQRGNNPTKKVSEKGPGDFFGEIALMYNSPRAATIQATTDGAVWSLDRESFQMMLVTTENTKKKTYETLLDDIILFDSLNKYEKGQLSDLLQEELFEKDEVIFKQNEIGKKFFIIQSGDVEVYMKGPNKNDKEIFVRRYTDGNYFGEYALLTNQLRRATVIAKSDEVSILWIDSETFHKVILPVKEQLLTIIKQYPTYDELIAKSKKK